MKKRQWMVKSDGQFKIPYVFWSTGVPASTLGDPAFLKGDGTWIFWYTLHWCRASEQSARGGTGGPCEQGLGELCRPEKPKLGSMRMDRRGFSPAEHCISCISSKLKWHGVSFPPSSKSFKLLVIYRYTLGGFYLAKYDSSPAGVFDELVVLAGIVWNPPTSCAWAARVIVNSNDARDHGIDEVGLPSRTAEFSLRTSTSERKFRNPWWNILPKGRERSRSNPAVDIVESDGSSLRRPLCNIELLNNAVVGAQGAGWQGPSMKMSLPSFSGKTELQPDLLKYSCRLNCRVRPVSPARVSPLPWTEEEASQCGSPPQQLDWDVMSVLTGKPVVALAFENMAMFVEAPTVVVDAAAAAEQQTAKGKQGQGLWSWFPRFKAPAQSPTASAS